VVQNRKTPVCSRLSSHPFFACPKHGASPLFQRWMGRPEWFPPAIVGIGKRLGGLDLGHRRGAARLCLKGTDGWSRKCNLATAQEGEKHVKEF
jgi:hypothetical protein